MFKDKYRKDNEKIEIPKATDNYIKQRLKDANNSADSRQTIWRPALRRNLIAAAVLVLVAAVALTAVGISRFQTTGDKIPNDVSQDQTVSQPPAYEGYYNKISSVLAAKKEAEKDRGTYKDYAESAESAGVTEDSVEYSETNTQVDGVDEADVVKTDGSYIYRLYDNKVAIIRAGGKDMAVAATIDLPKFYYGEGDEVLSASQAENTSGFDKDNYIHADEIYLQNGRLAAINNYVGDKILVFLYNVEQPENPKYITTVSQSGQYIDSRLDGDILYIYTNHYINDEIDRNRPETFVPACGSDSDILPEEDLYILSDRVDSKYFVAASYSIKDGTALSHKAVLGGGETIYQNSSNILVAEPDYSSYIFERKEGASDDTFSNNSTATSLISFSIKNGIISKTASGSVPGTLLNQFSMDEQGGYFRIVTSLSKSEGTGQNRESTTTNGVYVFDTNLNLVGRLDGLAKDENVYSVRFIDDICYFVTFRQVDPLFAVDLTTPQNPKLLSSLKIPGFSEYLHPFGEGKLFGFGKAASNSGFVEGLKLSMFDISSPKDVKEITKTELYDSGYSEASSNHKAIIVDPEKNIIGFSAAMKHDNIFKYYVFGYSEQSGFYKKMEMNLDMPQESIRGGYIGQYFYVSTDDGVTCFNMDNWQKVSEIVF